MKKFEYQTILIDAKGLWGGVLDANKFNQAINNMGIQGWELVEALSNNQVYGGTRSVVCIFKREMN